jgi:hypothetical protein
MCVLSLETVGMPSAATNVRRRHTAVAQGVAHELRTILAAKVNGDRVMASKASKRVQRNLTDHEEIREWAEARQATPSCVKGTEGKDGACLLRLDFPGYSGEQSLQPIEWDQWFEVFDQRGLALIVEDKMADGKPSNFNKLVSRSSANA